MENCHIMKKRQAKVWRFVCDLICEIAAVGASRSAGRTAATRKLDLQHRYLRQQHYSDKGNKGREGATGGSGREA